MNKGFVGFLDERRDDRLSALSHRTAHGLAEFDPGNLAGFLLGNTSARAQDEPVACLVDQEIEESVQFEVRRDLGEERPQHGVWILGREQNRRRLPQEPQALGRVASACSTRRRLVTSVQAPTRYLG